MGRARAAARGHSASPRMLVVLIDAATRREGHRAHSGCELFNTEIHETAASAAGELALERTQRSPECSQGTPINKSEHVGPSPRPSAQPPERLSTEKGALLVVWGRFAGRCDHESPTTRMSTTTLEDLYPRGGPRHPDATAPAVRVGGAGGLRSRRRMSRTLATSSIGTTTLGGYPLQNGCRRGQS